MAAMQVQLRVIGKQVKSDTVSVDNVCKISHVQHEQYWARTEPCGTEQTMYTIDEVPPAYTTRTDMNGTTSKLFHADQIDAQVAATAARDR